VSTILHKDSFFLFFHSVVDLFVETIIMMVSMNPEPLCRQTVVNFNEEYGAWLEWTATARRNRRTERDNLLDSYVDPVQLEHMTYPTNNTSRSSQFDQQNRPFFNNKVHKPKPSPKKPTPQPSDSSRFLVPSEVTKKAPTTDPTEASVRQGSAAAAAANALLLESDLYAKPSPKRKVRSPTSCHRPYPSYPPVQQVEQVGLDCKVSYVLDNWKDFRSNRVAAANANAFTNTTVSLASTNASICTDKKMAAKPMGSGVDTVVRALQNMHFTPSDHAQYAKEGADLYVSSSTSSSFSPTSSIVSPLTIPDPTAKAIAAVEHDQQHPLVRVTTSIVLGEQTKMWKLLQNETRRRNHNGEASARGKDQQRQDKDYTFERTQPYGQYHRQHHHHQSSEQLPCSFSSHFAAPSMAPLHSFVSTAARSSPMPPEELWMDEQRCRFMQQSFSATAVDGKTDRTSSITNQPSRNDDSPKMSQAYKYHPPNGEGGAATVLSTMKTSPRSIKPTNHSSNVSFHTHLDELDNGNIARNHQHSHLHNQGSFSSQPRRLPENTKIHSTSGLLLVPCLECHSTLQISEKNTVASSVVYCQTCGTMASAELMRSIARGTDLGNPPEE
jgi:hypothetical protein